MVTITGSNGSDTLYGTEGSDTINPLLGRDTVDGRGGRDTLIVDYSSAYYDPYAGASIANVPSIISSNGGSFSGAVKIVDGGNYVNFSSIEHLQVKLDTFRNTFKLDGSALALGATVVLDGSEGADILEADLSALDSVDLQFGADNTTASFGTIISFEVFRLNLTEGADHVTTGGGNDTLTGNGGDDVLSSGAGEDILSGGSGSNVLNAGDGNDNITSAGIDTVDGGLGFDRWTGDYGSSTVDLVFTRDSAAGTATLSNGTTLNGIESISGLTTGSGDDVFTFSGGYSGLIAAGAGEDSLTFSGSGYSGRISAANAAGAFAGNLGDSRFSGIEHLSFVSRNVGDAIIVDGAPLLDGATLFLDAAGGNDVLVMDLTAFGSISFIVAADGSVTTNVPATLLNFERYRFTSGSGDDLFRLGAANDEIHGNAGDDQLEGGDGNDKLDGGAGADRLVGGRGDDVYVIDATADRVTEALGAGIDTVESSISYALGSNFEKLVLTGTAAQGRGNGLANHITGNAVANILIGGAGADTMKGGAGDDIYYVDNTGDTAVEGLNSGIDIVRSSVDFALGANVEKLVLTGPALRGTGNGLANALFGNSSANVLDGGAGADTMRGGAGDDVYYIDNVGDKAVEGTNAGVETVLASADFTLGLNVEKLVLTGMATRGTGNGLANDITGNARANILDGAVGADTMRGGAGNDTYHVDDAGDTVKEGLDAGVDTVRSSVDFTLGLHVENLVLMGAAVRGKGNGVANDIAGNAEANILIGAGGADTMRGGAGNDTYYVDDVGDTAVEGLEAGIDTVRSSVDFTLGFDVERLVLTDTARRGTGNDLANSLFGNSSANVLNGGAGADRMIGGAGNDTYFIDNVRDKAVEGLDGGLDTVRSAMDFTLGAHVENLVLAGMAVSGTGNDLANSITGSSRANLLAGGAGDDVLDGRLGNDELRGGSGSDMFHFDTALSATLNVDEILDFEAAADSIGLDRSVFTGIGADGTLAASAFHSGATAQGADDRILYDAATGSIYYDADGTGAAAAILFATVTPGTSLSSTDFIAFA